MSTNVVIINKTTWPDLPKHASFQKWVGAALLETNKFLEVSLVIVDAEEMSEFNHKYRNKNEPTNVLSFPFNNPPGFEANILGDIILCAPIIAEEAIKQGKTLHAHFAHLTIHGCLHCLGYEHSTNTSAQTMENLEIKYLASLGFNNPYEEHS